MLRYPREVSASDTSWLTLRGPLSRIQAPIIRVTISLSLKSVGLSFLEVRMFQPVTFGNLRSRPRGDYAYDVPTQVI